jgi:prevent-host-death family protein
MVAKQSKRSRVVNMHEAKTRLSELVEAAKRGEQVTIARNGEPAVVLVPVQKTARAPAGVYRGQLRVGADFNDPLPADFTGIEEP